MTVMPSKSWSRRIYETVIDKQKMKKYQCDICEKEHPVYYGSDSPIPEFVNELLELEDEKRLIQIAETAFLVDNDKFITKGLLEIDTNFNSEQVYHYLWLEIPASNFRNKMDLLKTGTSIKLEGKIIFQVPFFEDLDGLEAELTINPDNPIGQIKVLTESQIKQDQQKPITKERFIQMMQRINHPEQWRGKAIFDKSFKERLSEIIEQANSEYKLKGRNFVIDISNQRENLIQLISSELLASPSDKGIGLHLSNDETNLNYKEVNTRMVPLCQNNSIIKFLWDEIDTYQKDYELNDVTLFDDIEQIISNVFNENLEEMELYIFEP